MKDLEKLVSVLQSLSPDFLGIADVDQHEGFIEAITKYQQFANVKNTGAASPVIRSEDEPAPRKAHTKGAKKPYKRSSAQTTYIIRKVNGTLLAAPSGSHASPRGIFTVRGHYRHYKSGKVVWVAEYKKGTGKKKSKTYKVGGDRT